MKVTPLKASLVALAVFAAAGTGAASSASATEPMVLAQAETEAGQDFAAVRKFIAGGRNLSRLDAGQLQQRLRRAERLKRTENLPADLAQALDQEIAEINAALNNQQAATGGAADGGQQAAAGDEQQENAGNNRRQRRQQQAENAGGDGNAGANAGAEQQQAQAGGSSAEVDSFLQSVQPVSSLDRQQLRQQTRRAQQLARSQGISDEQRRELRRIIREGRTAMQAGGGQNENGNQQADGGQQGGQGQASNNSNQNGTQTAQAGAGSNADIDAFLQSVKPASGLDEQALRQQMRRATELSRTQGISGEQRRELRRIARESRAEMQRRGNGGGGNNAGGGQNQQEGGNQTAETPTSGGNQQGGNAGSADAERNARAILDANANVRQMDRAELRKRLSNMRELLASNQLSPETKRALRQRLAEERTVLRSQVDQSATTNQGSNTTQGGNVNGNNNTVTNNNTTINNNITNQEVQVILRDRRPSDRLEERELRRRIEVYRRAVDNRELAEAERRELRVILERDRLVLRNRLIDSRRVRAERLRNNRDDIDIDLSLNFQPNRPVPPRSVFAAEAEDEEIVDVLAAPPRRKIERRYTVEEVQSDPGLRDAVARIEIDTVNFGFGEGFLREEEVDKLDRIAEVLEQILAESPGEVFMIEGHTDAVGSDAANLELSRERSRAVKEALTTYYVIPEENLKTVGFGERYLKIPTPEPEAENRRVSIARITPLVGALD